MSTIRERDAEWIDVEPRYNPLHHCPNGDIHRAQRCEAFVVEDRRALLAAGDALAEAADELAWPWRNNSVTSPMTRLLAAIARWREVAG